MKCEDSEWAPGAQGPPNLLRFEGSGAAFPVPRHPVVDAGSVESEGSQIHSWDSPTSRLEAGAPSAIEDAPTRYASPRSDIGSHGLPPRCQAGQAHSRAGAGRQGPGRAVRNFVTGSACGPREGQGSLPLPPRNREGSKGDGGRPRSSAGGKHVLDETISTSPASRARATSFRARSTTGGSIFEPRVLLKAVGLLGYRVRRGTGK